MKFYAKIECGEIIMNSTEVLTIEETGKLILPNDIVERYQFKK